MLANLRGGAWQIAATCRIRPATDPLVSASVPVWEDRHPEPALTVRRRR
jgi:hypothetical protein